MPEPISTNHPLNSKHQRYNLQLVFALLAWTMPIIFIAMGLWLAKDYFAGQNYLNRLAARETAGNIPDSTAKIAAAGYPLKPTGLSIPSLGLTSSIEPVGLTSDHSLQIPNSPTTAGWYVYGPVPGQNGASILDGHLDTATSTALFWHLHDIRTGDEIDINRSDGSTAVFTVTGLARYSQDNFPTTAVYAATAVPSLRLITCAGTWERSAHHYSENLVVYAELKTIYQN